MNAGFLVRIPGLLGQRLFTDFCPTLQPNFSALCAVLWSGNIETRPALEKPVYAHLFRSDGILERSVIFIASPGLVKTSGEACAGSKIGKF